MQATFRHTRFAAYIGYITQAIVNNLAPLLFVTFSREFGLSLDQISLLITLNFTVQILTDLVTIKLLRRIGYRSACVAAHIFAAAGLVGYSILPYLLPPYTGLALSGILCAIGGGLDEVVISPVVEALPGDEKASTMSLLHSFYCWGQMLVVIGSTLFFLIFGLGAWRYLPCIWAVIPALNAALFRIVPIRTLEEEGGCIPLRELVKNRTFLLMCIVMVCSGASELSMSQWASLFAEEGLHVSKTIGDLLGPCTFAALMGTARMIYSFFGKHMELQRVIVWSGMLCVGCYLAATLIPNPIAALLSCAVCGFAVGIMWPGTYSLSAQRIPNGGAAMFALLAFAGDIGCASGPTIAGLVGDAAGSIRIGLLTAVIFPLGLVICLLTLKRRRTDRTT